MFTGPGYLGGCCPGSSAHTMYVHFLIPGAALGPLLAGLISPSGWNNVFYMLMFADACALLVSRLAFPPRLSQVSLWLSLSNAGDACCCGLPPLPGDFGPMMRPSAPGPGLFLPLALMHPEQQQAVSSRMGERSRAGAPWPRILSPSAVSGWARV